MHVVFPVTKANPFFRLYQWIQFKGVAHEFHSLSGHLWAVSSVAQSCPTLCDSVDCSMPGFPVHQFSELAQTHVC